MSENLKAYEHGVVADLTINDLVCNGFEFLILFGMLRHLSIKRYIVYTKVINTGPCLNMFIVNTFFLLNHWPFAIGVVPKKTY